MSIFRRWAEYVARIAPLLLVSLALPQVGAALQVNPNPTPVPVTPPPASQVTLLTDPVPDPHASGVEWFAPTGHTLRGSFLTYWHEHGGLAQFGYPLTEEFFEEAGPDHKQYQVQYFERNRFEHHPENAGTQYEVLLGSLGIEFHPADPAASPVPNAQFFQATGHNLSGVFRTYWQAHGGLAVYGYPLSEQITETNALDHKQYTVQYFERARFELHPENAGTQYEVLLGQLGRQLSEKNGYPFGRYPLYGYAPDYSWFAGYYKADNSKCQPCGCSTIRYVNPATVPLSGQGEVLPYIPGTRQSQRFPLGESQDPRLTPTLDPQNFLVIFGSPDDPKSIPTKGQPGASCLLPKFKVDHFQFNPAR